jgi:hypothetical protein
MSMEIRFFEDPLESPKSREDVRIRTLGLYVYEDKRRVAVGFDITPFLENPSIDIQVVNANGLPAGSMSIVNTVETNFTLTLHLRDEEPTDLYMLTAALYYASPDGERVDIQKKTATFDLTRPGEQ